MTSIVSTKVKEKEKYNKYLSSFKNFFTFYTPNQNEFPVDYIFLLQAASVHSWLIQSTFLKMKQAKLKKKCDTEGAPKVLLIDQSEQKLVKLLQSWPPHGVCQPSHLITYYILLTVSTCKNTVWQIIYLVMRKNIFKNVHISFF